MKNFSSLFFLCFLFVSHVSAQRVVGADVSWCSEMESQGKAFYDAEGKKTELMQLLHGIGMSAVRLRVWVNPSYTATPSESCYGSAWCNKADVVAKAKRAKSAGMDVMIDFHYSDFFVDPSRQNVPNDWKGKTFNEVKDLVASHTTEVLEALKAEGVTPRWIQIGNETASGMLYGYGDITWTPNNFSNFVTLYNAGYDAAKAVCPHAYVMPHKNTGSADNIWWFDAFKWAGGKFDMIALSHYPQTDDTSKTAEALNTALVEQMKTMYDKYGVQVMIAETGVKVNDNETLATAALSDLSRKICELDARQDICAGVFYWEPEIYNWWKPSAYTKIGWGAYNMGAFYRNGSPSKALTSFVESVAPASRTLMGDMNNDGTITIDDANILVNISLGKELPRTTYSADDFIRENKLSGSFLRNGIAHEYLEGNPVPKK